MTNTAVLQLHQRETFERNVTRALVAGAGAGVVAFVASRLHLPIPLSFLAVVGATLACVRGKALERLSLAAMATTLPALPWLFGLGPGWTVAMAGAVAGALMVKSRVTEKGEEGSLGAVRPGAMHYVGGALATAGLAVAGTEVAKILSSRMTDVQTPLLFNLAISGTIVALFAGLGSLASHVALKNDPVEAECEELIATTTGDFATQIAKGLALYRQAGQQLASLPREPAREELARTIQKLTKDAVALAREWAGVESSVHEDAYAALQKEIDELVRSAAAARDAVARQQLELAASSLKEELTRLAEMRLKRERVLAKLKAQVALLERARVSLIGMRSSHATVRAAEMSAVSRKLSALAAGQADEARLAHEVATTAEINANEKLVADFASREQIAAVKAEVSAVISPVVEVGSSTLTATDDEKLKN